MRGSLLVLGLAGMAAWVGCSSGGDTQEITLTGGSAGMNAGGSSGMTAGSAGVGQGGSAGAASGGTSSGGSGGTSSGGSSSGGTGAVQDAGVPDVTFFYDADIGDGAVTQDSACATASAAADPLPLDMYVMLDQSGSMGSDCNVGSNGTSKWCYAINALDGYFGDPSAAGNGVALQYFPLSNGTCPGAGYATPNVGYGLLPANRNALRTSMDAHAPGGGTPMEGALNGLAIWTAANKKPNREMIAILVTDGVPEAGCSNSGSLLAGIAGTLLANSNIKTFAIGMTGASFSILEQIATSGGSPSHTNYCANGAMSCHYYNVGNGNPAAFIDALKQIQQSVLGCTFSAPTTDAGIINWNNVNLQYTPMGTGAPQTVGRVNDMSGCTSSGGGWYYDNNNNPTQISLCPSTCTVVQSDSQAKIDVLLGCLGS